jgi:hypothetical protein
MSIRVFASSLLGFALAAPMLFAAEAADTIFHGGDIVTIEDQQPNAEALAVKAGKIIAVGKKDDVLKFKGDATKLIDLGGKTLLITSIPCSWPISASSMHRQPVPAEMSRVSSPNSRSLPLNERSPKVS